MKAPTCNILHPCLGVVGITDVQDIYKSVCDRIQEKNACKGMIYF